MRHHTRHLARWEPAVFEKNDLLSRIYRLCAFCVIALSVAGTTQLLAQDKAGKAAAPSSTTAGLSVEQLSKLPAVLFARELSDVPGKNLVVVSLKMPPRSSQQSSDAQHDCLGHRHPGSTYVYVTKGTMRLGIAGAPVQTVRTGESFFEPPGALHNVAENASTTEPAEAIAVLIVPAGAALLTPEKCGKP